MGTYIHRKLIRPGFSPAESQRPWRAQDGPRWPPERPRTGQEGPKTPKKAPRRPKRPPRRPQEGLNWKTFWVCFYRDLQARKGGAPLHALVLRAMPSALTLVAPRV